MDFAKLCEMVFPDEYGKTTFLLQGINFSREWQTIAKGNDQFVLEQTMEGHERSGLCDWDDMRVIREEDYLLEQKSVQGQP